MSLTRSKIVILILLALTQFLVVLDSAIVNVALPEIKDSLGFTDSSLQWILTAYVLTFGGFLLLGGRAADLYGRRKVLVTGLAGFTITSLLIGLSQSSESFIVLRAIQGLTAAFMSPAAMSVLLTTFKEGHERNRALSIWSIVAAGGAAAGVLLGGIITQLFGWHWDFFINVPIGILTIIGILKYVPAHIKEESDKNLDLPGAALITFGLIALVFAISQAPEAGLTDPYVIVSFIASIVLIAAFLYNESRVKHPLVPLSVFKLRNVSGGNLIMVPAMASMLGMFFFISLYMQNILGYTPIQSGLAFLPFPIILGTMAWNAPKLVDRFGIKKLLTVGTILPTIGIALLTILPLDGNYFIHILPSILLIPAGMGLFFVAAILAATSGVPARESGLVSGLINTSQQVGGALGIAVLAGVAAFATGSSSTLAAQLSGFHAAFIAATLLMVGALFVAIFVIKVPKR
ncbi:MAG: Drug resistance transporter, EmrB/QacA subfamily [Candidatus Saccharibacteria bacterium GW2011_GWC2_48_9]|nr:MAG: Drug resistance transporter, EmrB/QacA subfamily [Candidatus Saccharibacteria bacterium GW2011_GWC2_48_9]HCH34353.1 MFS transporter [Candidatus Saccharibacteria bacterium]